MPDLNSMMEFDHVIQVNSDGTVNTDPQPHVYAPESVIETDDDGQILEDHERAYVEYMRSQGWELLTGRSGQYSYSGPIMHPSEYVGGALEEYIRETPGLYVVVTVETLDDLEDAAGWVVAYREINE